MTDREASILLGLARDAIFASLQGGKVVVPAGAWLETPRAVFVSLHHARTGDLRGCVGTIDPHEPLGQAVVMAAEGAAFRDTRFSPLSASELPDMRLEISVLSPLTLLPAPTEADARAAVARLRSGVVLHVGPHRSVLLPKVWASIPDPAEFLRVLKKKAGLPTNAWPESLQLFTFTCEECSE